MGSVGTRCWIVLMFGRDDSDPLFLQVKEAQASVLGPYAGGRRPTNQGQRVVEGQRLTQAASDIFLGWVRVEAGVDGKRRDFYVRQLRDWKFSFAIETMVPEGMRLYGQQCGWTLARAHARSGDRIAIGGYLGARMRLTRRSRSSPVHTPIRMSATTMHCARLLPRGESPCGQTSEQPSGWRANRAKSLTCAIAPR